MRSSGGSRLRACRQRVDYGRGCPLVLFYVSDLHAVTLVKIQLVRALPSFLGRRCRPTKPHLERAIMSSTAADAAATELQANLNVSGDAAGQASTSYQQPAEAGKAQQTVAAAEVPHPSGLSLDQRFALCRSVAEECVSDEELRRLLMNKPAPVA
jgi:hypothetical protein